MSADDANRDVRPSLVPGASVVCPRMALARSSSADLGVRLTAAVAAK